MLIAINQTTYNAPSSSLTGNCNQDNDELALEHVNGLQTEQQRLYRE